MSYCPVCNGLDSFEYICPKCQSKMEDSGKLSDFFSDYSPYREIDDVNLTNGFLDVQENLCLHVAYCPQCGYDQITTINEIEN